MSTWIRDFVNKPENSFLCIVNTDFIEDAFNLQKLHKYFCNGIIYEYALDLILDEKINVKVWKYKKDEIELAAEKLYGLIHARYICTNPGIYKMVNKYYYHSFGTCPRILCNGFPVIPIGQNDIPGISTVKLYCSNCKDIYQSDSKLDSAYFGSSFPHLLLHNFPMLTHMKDKEKFIPKIYGFKISSNFYKSLNKK